MNPGYFAIIPASVRYDENLIPNAKLMYGEITALANKDGFCFATNLYFSNLYGVSEYTVSRWISQLRDHGHIDVFIDNMAGNKRKITIAEKRKTYCGKAQDLLTKSATPIDEKRNSNKRNNSIIKSISNITDLDDFKKFSKEKSNQSILKSIYDENQIKFDMLLGDGSFHERIMKRFEVENLKVDFQKDVMPVLVKWMCDSWTAGTLDSTSGQIKQKCTSFIYAVVKDGGLGESRSRTNKVDEQRQYSRKSM